MLRIIEGKRYNTETATCMTTLECNVGKGDFGWHDTALYRTPKGAWFLSGEGYAASMWSQPAGNMRGPGDGIRVIDDDEARRILEDEDAVDLLAQYFPIEDA